MHDTGYGRGTLKSEVFARRAKDSGFDLSEVHSELEAFQAVVWHGRPREIVGE